MSTLWDKLDGDDKLNVVSRYLTYEPGKHCSCLARELDVSHSSISCQVKKLIKTGKVKIQPQKMKLDERRSVKVNRLYLDDQCAPEIDYDNDRFDPQTTACATIWYSLDSDAKKRLVLRELAARPEGISIRGLSKRIGLELFACKRWVKRMEQDRDVTIRGKMVHIQTALKANVISVDKTHVYILCPICGRVHSHGSNGIIGDQNYGTRVPHCTDVGLRYISGRYSIRCDKECELICDQNTARFDNGHEASTFAYTWYRKNFQDAWSQAIRLLSDEIRSQPDFYSFGNNRSRGFVQSLLNKELAVQSLADRMHAVKSQ